MRKKLFAQIAAACLPFAVAAQDANVILDGFNSYYNTYDNNTKNITGIVVEVGADGTNSSNYISSDFLVSLYLLPCDNTGSVTGNTPIIIATYTVNGGTLHQMGTYTFSNQTVDLSQVSGLADGLYRMGAWVNSDPTGTGIGNPPDDPSDNAGLLQSNSGTSAGSVINFTTANGVVTFDLGEHVTLYPVPAADELVVGLKEGHELTSVQVEDLSGRVVLPETPGSGSREMKIDVSGLSNGIYFLQVRSGGQLARRRAVIAR